MSHDESDGETKRSFSSSSPLPQRQQQRQRRTSLLSLTSSSKNKSKSRRSRVLPVEFEWWTTERRRLYLKSDSQPERYFYRYPHHLARRIEGPLHEKEREWFVHLLKWHPHEGQWGLWALANFPGRSGEECQRLAEQLQEQEESMKGSEESKVFDFVKGRADLVSVLQERARDSAHSEHKEQQEQQDKRAIDKKKSEPEHKNKPVATAVLVNRKRVMCEAAVSKPASKTIKKHNITDDSAVVFVQKKAPKPSEPTSTSSVQKPVKTSSEEAPVVSSFTPPLPVYEIKRQHFSAVTDTSIKAVLYGREAVQARAKVFHEKLNQFQQAEIKRVEAFYALTTRSVQTALSEVLDKCMTHQAFLSFEEQQGLLDLEMMQMVVPVGPR